MKNTVLSTVLAACALAACGSSSNNTGGGDNTSAGAIKVEDFPAKTITAGCTYSRAGGGQAVYQSLPDGAYAMRVNGKDIVVRFNAETSAEEGGGYRVQLDVVDDEAIVGGGKGTMTVTEISTGKEVKVDVVQDCEM